MQPIYLDYAATTPLDEQVEAAMRPYYREQFYNPSAQYLAAKGVKQSITEARSRIAHHFGAKPSEIIFTAGGSEANNLAISGVLAAYPGKTILVSSVEHDSVLEPARQHGHKELPVLPDGRLDLVRLEAAITDDTVLISVQYVNNEIGTIQPIKEIAAIISQVRKQRRDTGNTLPLYFHSDACQAAGYLDIHASRLGVDLMTINAGKIYGPKQVGVLYVRTGVILQPIVWGGGQERSLRSGTENVPGIIGLSVALDMVQDRRHEESRRLLELQRYFEQELSKGYPAAQFNGSRKHRLVNTIHVTFPGLDNERLMMELDERGILCAVGSACSASSDEPSHVLRAIGMSDEDARSSLRFSVGKYTSHEDIERTVQILLQLLS